MLYNEKKKLEIQIIKLISENKLKNTKEGEQL